MSEVDSTPPLPGEVLAGKYRIEEVLGSGGMGTVVAAMHLDLQELRAIKLMHPEAAGDARAVERFLREARAVARLKSDHVVKVYDVGRLESGAPYIVMEHLVGSDLGKISRRQGPLPIEDAARYVREAAGAIAEAHTLGIVHRDLKPSNLFLTTTADGSPRIKVLDFGISKISQQDDGSSLDMTRTRELLGSPLYMAPEQMRSMHTVDARSDVWGLGVILYKLVTGRLPFFAKGLTEICAVVLERPLIRPSMLRPDLPPDLEAVILHCLVKDPAKRLASAADLAAALAPFATARTSEVPILVDLVDEPDADPLVSARTTPFDGTGIDHISVDLLDEPEASEVPRGPMIPELPSRPRSASKVAGERARAARMRRWPPAQGARPGGAQRGGLSSVLVAVIAGLVGGFLSIVGGGALVSRHQEVIATRVRTRAPVQKSAAPPAPVNARAQPDTPQSESPPRSSVVEACHTAWRPSRGLGSPEDPFQIFARP